MLLVIANMVGQQVRGAAADKRADMTDHDAEAVPYECRQIQTHLRAQICLLYTSPSPRD